MSNTKMGRRDKKAKIRKLDQQAYELETMLHALQEELIETKKGSSEQIKLLEEALKQQEQDFKKQNQMMEERIQELEKTKSALIDVIKDQEKVLNTNLKGMYSKIQKIAKELLLVEEENRMLMSKLVLNELENMEDVTWIF